MKTKFYLFVLLFFVGFIQCLFGQQGNSPAGTDNSDKQKEIPVYNLYYLSKYLNDAKDDDSEKIKAYHSLMNLLEGTNSEALFTNQNAYPELSKFINSIRFYKTILSKYYISLLKAGDFDKFENDAKTFLTEVKIRKSSENEFKAIKEAYKNKMSKEQINDTLSQIKKALEGKDSIDINDTLTRPYKDFMAKQKLIDTNHSLYIRKTFNEGIREIEADKINLEEDLNKKIASFVDSCIEYKSKQKNNQLKTSPVVYKAAAQTQTQIQLNSIIQTSQSGGASSTGISLPSESQIINAMAIFLANRAKQEAVIWFMDQIRSKLNNPMIYDVFPETIKMIEELENYKAPNFSASWRYAIAKDFAELPRNLVNSSWVKDVIIKNPDHIERLKAGVELGYNLNRLMAQQYNYREIIRYFYLNRMNKSGNSSGINAAIDNSFKILYIVTNELFAIDNVDGRNVYRLLSYEEIQSLSKEQFHTLLELINLKYGDVPEKILNATSDEDKKNFTGWVGNLLISLAQFDKIKNDIKQSQEQSKLDLSNLNFNSVWKILLQIVDNLESNNILAGTQIGENLKFIKPSLNIYEDLQSNNFLAAVKSTFSLIEMAKDTAANKLKPGKDLIVNGSVKIQIIDMSCNTFEIKNRAAASIFVKIDTVKSVLSISDNPDFDESASLKIQEFNGISAITKYLTGKGDIYNLIKNKMNSDTLKFDRIKSYSKKTGVNEIALLKMINYVYLISMKDSLTSRKIYGVLNEAKDYIQEYNSKYSDQLIKLLSFFGDVLMSKDENGLANVIDSYALPPTSYKLKRRMAYSVDLNAYVGASGGWLLSKSTSSFDNQFTYGITAPIGVAVTKTTKHWIDHYGFTIDAFDLGNLVNHYLISPNTEYSKEVHVSEIFSPGLTLVGGIRNSPFVIYLGVKWQPFKTFSEDEVVYNNRSFDATILHAGIKIDIPLINLKSKAK